MRRIKRFFRRLPANILDVVTMPFRFAWWVLDTPRRQFILRRNWKQFQDDYYDQIQSWMKTHGEKEKLPIVRNDDLTFTWVTRAQRRRTARNIKKLLA